MEGVMVGQNLKRMNAKLNLDKVAMLQYEKSSQYYVEQGKFMQNQVQKLAELAKEEDHEYSKSYQTLSDFSKHSAALYSFPIISSRIALSPHSSSAFALLAI